MQSLTIDDWLNALKNASSFDLYRLRALITDELDNPERLMRTLLAIRPGQQLHYYDHDTRQQRRCEVYKVYQKYVGVRDLETNQRFRMPPYMLNLDGKPLDDVSPAPEAGRGLDKHQLKVGDRLVFSDKQGQDITATIDRLNTKTVSLTDDDGMRWRVAYALLRWPPRDI